jgi:hypothetical protein
VDIGGTVKLDHLPASRGAVEPVYILGEYRLEQPGPFHFGKHPVYHRGLFIVVDKGARSLIKQSGVPLKVFNAEKFFPGRIVDGTEESAYHGFYFRGGFFRYARSPAERTPVSETSPETGQARGHAYPGPGKGRAIPGRAYHLNKSRNVLIRHG